MNSTHIERDVLDWRIAKKSALANCVEVAGTPDGAILVRHSRHPYGEMLAYTPAEWDAFLDGVKRGEFDDLLNDPESIS